MLRNNLELAGAIEALRQELSGAREGDAVDPATADAADLYLVQAVREANMPDPSKTTLLDHLDSARERLSGRPPELIESVARVIEEARELL